MCSICSLGFFSDWDRNAHERLCIRDGALIRCTCCNATFRSPEAWKLHKRDTRHSFHEILRPARAVATAVVEPLSEGEAPPEHEALVLSVVLPAAVLPRAPLAALPRATGAAPSEAESAAPAVAADEEAIAELAREFYM